jgi:putative transposase
MAEWCRRCNVEIWAYCLMPNHAHLVAVPSTRCGLQRAIGEAHRRYTLEINLREGWRGHLWQGRFASFVMDERYTLAAARYIELNPVRAGLVSCAEEYAWSSARAHILGRDDRLVSAAPLLAHIPDWRTFLGGDGDKDAADIRGHETTGRPLGTDQFVDRMEALLGRVLRPGKPGRRAQGTKRPPEPARGPAQGR